MPTVLALAVALMRARLGIKDWCANVKLDITSENDDDGWRFSDGLQLDSR